MSLSDPSYSSSIWLRMALLGALILLIAFLITSVIGFDYFLAEPNSYPRDLKLRAIKFYGIGTFLGLGSFLLFAISVFSLPKGSKKFAAIFLWVLFGLIVLASLFQAIMMSILHTPH